MYKAVMPGAIGHGLLFKDAADAVAECGFEGYWFDINGDSKIAAEETREILARTNLKAAGFNLPVEFRKDAQTFENDLVSLKEYAAYAAAIGAKRCVTWILPIHETLDYAANFEMHTARLRKVAEILNEYGILLGLEFIGPPSIRKNAPHIFIYRLQEMLALCEAIGTGNCGVLADLWHWDLAGQKRADFNLFSNPDQIVLVHINDAPAGIPPDEQKDSIRCLPGETGVLKAADFFDGLRSVGYAGPVMAEPFVPVLGEMSFKEALKVTFEAMRKVMG
jgi:sugar phosphate isomerase/epimerase